MRHIRITPEHIAQMKAKVLQKIDEQFNNVRVGDKGKIDLKFNMEDIELEEPIILNFTGLAYAKQCELVRSCSSEIAWHGLVQTDENRKLFHVHDILVYPQTVSGVTVTTDEKEYEAWKAKLNDEQFNTMRFQAHSHVNMAPSPSGTDRALYDKVLQNIGDNSFYIFMIMNKSHNMHIEIYDMKNNAYYDNSDLVVTVDGIDLDTWYGESFDKYVKKYTYNTPAVQSTRAYPAPVNPTPYPYNYYEDSFEQDYLTRYARETRENTSRSKKGGKK